MTAMADLQNDVLANQATILRNQEKLDKILANQDAIIVNQQTIQSNQEKLNQLLANQDKLDLILENQQKLLGK